MSPSHRWGRWYSRSPHHQVRPESLWSLGVFKKQAVRAEYLGFPTHKQVFKSTQKYEKSWRFSYQMAENWVPWDFDWVWNIYSYPLYYSDKAALLCHPSHLKTFGTLYLQFILVSSSEPSSDYRWTNTSATFLYWILSTSCENRTF